jgi:hypothetical protein
MFIAEVIAINRGIKDCINGENSWHFEDEMLNICYHLGKTAALQGYSKYMNWYELKFSRLKTMYCIGEEKRVKIGVEKVGNLWGPFAYTKTDGFKDILVRFPPISDKRLAIKAAKISLEKLKNVLIGYET